MPTAIIHTQNSAMDSTSEIFSADQVSTCRSCSRARRGPRPTPRLAVFSRAASAGRSVGREAAGRDAGAIGRAPAGGRVTAWVASIGSWVPVGSPLPAGRPGAGTGGAGALTGRGGAWVGGPVGAPAGVSGVTGWAAGGAGAATGSADFASAFASTAGLAAAGLAADCWV